MSKTDDGKDFLQSEMERLAHNSKAMRRMQKFAETGKLFDDDGKELNLADTVSYEIKKRD